MALHPLLTNLLQNSLKLNLTNQSINQSCLSGAGALSKPFWDFQGEPLLQYGCFITLKITSCTLLLIYKIPVNDINV